ncbi:tetratricopeptide repeat protein [Nocardiopsis tropica]|uniref:Tetratricopeptide repeat protein n=1 Tax=Nocardiopsis tropica TaxID=109330 RepID=A0ABU7KXE9_9ACTN|nr:tetratricopeptide repeat protein [Nocardiopsis umidischolae]MEE2053987.1 tetratricopeptide repeat protein [Nocardiopsis umidischolae]
MTDLNPRSDRIDFSGGTFYGKVVGKEEHHHSPAELRTEAPHSLPSAPNGFTGRYREEKELLRRLDPTGGADNPNGSGAVVVSAISGMGGIGKTALALHAAGIARGKGWFCAELFVDLHGFTPGAAPVEATAALDTMLRQMGVDPDDIPADLGERSGFYRSALQSLSHKDPGGRPVLVMADNAHHLAQIEPLLPGPGGHRLLVTSRGRLTVDGHRPLSLDLLSEGEAVELVANRLGPGDHRLRDEAGLVALVQRCGFLPLALKIAAALLARTTHLEPTQLAQRLAVTSTFTDGRDDLPTVFAASLDHLPADRVQAFALLGSNPGSDISTPAAAYLTGLEPNRVEEVLEDLAAAHLLTGHAGGRWSMHDLLADHARTLSLESDQANLRERNVKRLVGFYTMTASAAGEHLFPSSGATPSEVFPGHETALAWLDSERDNLIAAMHTARDIGLTSTPVVLAFALKDYLELRRRFEEAVVVLTLSCQAAHETGHADREAIAWNKLGSVLMRMRQFKEAENAQTRARDLFQRIGDTHGEAMAWNNLGFTLRELGQYEDAITVLNRARDLCRHLGDLRGEAMALGNLGATLCQSQRTEEAIETLIRARGLFHQVGDDLNEASSSINLGMALQQAARLEEAVDILTRALDFHHELNDVDGEALAWTNLGVALASGGRFDEAVDAHIRARDLSHEIGDIHGEATAWRNLGLASLHSHRWEEAITAFVYARDLNQRMGDISSEALVMNELGSALQEVDRLNEAIDAHTRARDLHRRCEDTCGEAKAWGNLGIAFQRAGRFDEAIDAHTHYLAHCCQAGNDHGEAAAWNNLAVALASVGRREEAHHAHEQAVQKFQNIGDPLALTIAEQFSARTRQRSPWRFWERRSPNTR